MKLNSIRYFLNGRRIAGTVWGTALLACMFACNSDYYQGETESNGLLKLDAGMPAASNFLTVNPIQDIRMLLSYRGGPYDGKFSYEIYDIARQTNTLTSQIKTGDWNLTLLSPQGTAAAQIHTPIAGKPMAGQLMYEYNPVADSKGNSSPAAEFLFGKVGLPTVATDLTTTVGNVAMARNVAKVELYVEKASNIDLGGTQKVELTRVPSKIDWEGHLMPSKTNPDTLKTPLVENWTFSALQGGGFKSDILSFIVPAHRGRDFMNPDGSLNDTPTDVVSDVMNVTIRITNSLGGVVLNKTKPLPQVVNCNRVLRIKVSLSSLDFAYLSYDFTTLPDWGGTVTSGSTTLQ